MNPNSHTKATSAATPPRIVVIGGSIRDGSVTEQLLRLVAGAVHPNAQVTWFCGPDLLLPHYAPGPLSPAGTSLVEAVRECDVLLVGSPGYHGSLSGTVKNALDYLEELRDARSPYLEGKVVGCVSTAYGWQAAVNTLGALRQVISALRGWCAPYGIAINVTDGYLDSSARLIEDRLDGPVQILASQISEFLVMSRRLELQPA